MVWSTARPFSSSSSLSRRASTSEKKFTMSLLVAKTGLAPLMEASSGGYTEVGRVLRPADVELLLSRGVQVDVIRS